MNDSDTDAVKVVVNNHFKVAEKSLRQVLARTEERIAAMLDEATQQLTEVIERTVLTLESNIVDKLSTQVEQSFADAEKAQQEFNDVLKAKLGDVTTLVTKLRDDQATFQKQIADLQAIIDAGSSDQAVMDRLKALVEKDKANTALLNALDVANPGTIPPPIIPDLPPPPIIPDLPPPPINPDLPPPVPPTNPDQPAPPPVLPPGSGPPPIVTP